MLYVSLSMLVRNIMAYDRGCQRVWHARSGCVCRVGTWLARSDVTPPSLARASVLSWLAGGDAIVVHSCVLQHLFCGVALCYPMLGAT